MNATVGAGQAADYDGVVVAGQVGIWSSDASDNTFDDFTVADAAGPYEIDGRWFGDRGDVRVDFGDNNVLETFGNDIGSRTMVRRGFRGDKFVLTYRFKWDTGMRKPGVLVRWLSPGDWLAIEVPSSDQKARLRRRLDDSGVTTLKTSGTALSLSAATWYTGKVVVDDDPNNAALQRLRFWVDTDDDGDYGDETVLLTSTQVDDDWSGGYVGLFRGNQDTNVHQFDDFKVGYDNNADGDFDDAGDVIAIDDDFGDNVTNGAVSLSYDANGNLTDDGVFAYAYDAWNRLRLAKLVVGSDSTTIGDYEYYGDTRRSRKIVSNHGPEVVANDGGDTEVRFVYAGWNPSGDTMSRWSIGETRDGSGQTTFQHLWGTRYIDELIWIERNGDPAIGDDTDPDDEATGEGSESPADARYVAHQDRNRSVLSLTEHDTDGTNNGRMIERYDYNPYGVGVALHGDAGEGEIAAVASSSSIGLAFEHQGLRRDTETQMLQNRLRAYLDRLERFLQRDPLAQSVTEYPVLFSAACVRDGGPCWYYAHQSVQPTRGLWVDRIAPYAYELSGPTFRRDPTGLSVRCGNLTCFCPDGTSRVPVRGKSRRAKLILEGGFGPGAQGCVTLLIPPSIVCTGDCSTIKDWEVEGTDGDRHSILDHECCHYCDGPCLIRYLAGAINDTCSEPGRRVGSIPHW